MGLCLSKDAGAASAGAPLDADAARGWFVASKPVPEATQRLVCLPWEGGSSLAFNHLVVPFTEVVAVELPGRMGRMKEPLATRVEAIVRPLAQAMALMGYMPSAEADSTTSSTTSKPLPLVLLGHSYLGATLALELAKVLVQEYGVQPRALVLSGCPAPQDLPRLYPAGGLAGLKGDTLGQYLVETGAIVAHVASNKDTMKSLLPLYKADLGAVEGYIKQGPEANPTPFFQCPILALTAKGSTIASPEALAGWKQWTTGGVEVEELAIENGTSNHYSHLRSGGTDGVVRSLTRVTLGRAILMKDVVAARRWFVAHYTPKADAKYRMLCLAWAGGNSSVYKTWRLPDVEILAVELPGRNARAKEAPLKSLHQIVTRFVQALEVLGYVNDPDRPLILFGHSFGAMQTLEIARLLRAKGHPLPHYLILSGCPPSDDGWGDTGVSSKTDKGIGDYLVWLGGLTPELAANKEIMDKVLPVIRGDYTAIDTYKYEDAPSLDGTRVLALTGENDIAAGIESMSGWKRFVVDPATQFQQVVFGGGSHFFAKDKADAVLKVIDEVVVQGKPAPEGKV